jgi:hypothetical protein
MSLINIMMITPKEILELGDWVLKDDTEITPKVKVKIAKVLSEIAFQMEYYEETVSITDSRLQTLLEINSNRKEQSVRQSLETEEIHAANDELLRQNEVLRTQITMLKEALYKS